MDNNYFKYATKECGINENTLSRFQAAMGAYVCPSVVEERRLNAVSMDVFSRLLMDRIIFLGVPIDDDVANIIQAQLLFLAAQDPQTEIKMYINSPGGQVSSGLAIYDTMQLITPPVSTLCTGMAASMGAVLLCAGEPGKRSILPHSRVMIHQPLGGASGQASDILIEAREIERARTELFSILSYHTGQPTEKIASDGERNFWMTAPEAINYGMADTIMKKHHEQKEHGFSEF